MREENCLFQLLICPGLTAGLEEYKILNRSDSLNHCDIPDHPIHTNEPLHEKTNNLGFRPGLTQTGLFSHRSRLEA